MLTFVLTVRASFAARENVGTLTLTLLILFCNNVGLNVLKHVADANCNTSKINELLFVSSRLSVFGLIWSFCADHCSMQKLN